MPWRIWLLMARAKLSYRSSTFWGLDQKVQATGFEVEVPPEFRLVGRDLIGAKSTREHYMAVRRFPRSWVEIPGQSSEWLSLHLRIESSRRNGGGSERDQT
jgi:hypothetical protein